MFKNYTIIQYDEFVNYYYMQKTEFCNSRFTYVQYGKFINYYYM